MLSLIAAIWLEVFSSRFFISCLANIDNPLDLSGREIRREDFSCFTARIHSRTLRARATIHDFRVFVSERKDRRLIFRYSRIPQHLLALFDKSVEHRAPICRDSFRSVFKRDLRVRERRAFIRQGRVVYLLLIFEGGFVCFEPDAP